MAHKWARWPHHSCRLGGSPHLQSRGQNQKWPTSGQGGYITPTASGIPTASVRGAKSEVAHRWARWLHYPCHLGSPHRFRARHPCRLGGSPPLQSGGQIQKWPTSGQGSYITPASLGDPHRLRSGGQNQKWPTSGQGGYITIAASGDPHRLRAGGQNQKWPTSGQGSYITTAASGDPHRFRARGKMRRGTQVGKVAT